MTDKHDLWNLLNQTISTLLGSVPRVTTIVDGTGLTNVFQWGCLSWSVLLDPEPFAADTPFAGYNAPVVFIDALTALDDLGYLERAGEKGYLPSGKGRTLMKHVSEVRNQAAIAHKPLADNDMTIFIQTLDHLVAAIHTLTEPEKPRFETRLRFRPIIPNPAPTLTLLSTLRRIEEFRQDSHNAAWKLHNIGAHAWEILSFLWREEATGYDTLPEYVTSSRGFTRLETEAAFDVLLDRGWITQTEEPGNYRMTKPGNTIRQEAEDLTDQYFFSAWNQLSETNLQDLHTLTTKVQAYFTDRQPNQE